MLAREECHNVHRLEKFSFLFTFQVALHQFPISHLYLLNKAWGVLWSLYIYCHLSKIIKLNICFSIGCDVVNRRRKERVKYTRKYKRGRLPFGSGWVFNRLEDACPQWGGQVSLQSLRKPMPVPSRDTLTGTHPSGLPGYPSIPSPGQVSTSHQQS